MKAKKIVIAFLCLTLSICFLLPYYSIIKIERYTSDLTREIENQAREIEKLNKETFLWQCEINNLYEMNTSHANCVAMAVLMNESSVLAYDYGRTEEEQMKLYGDDSRFAGLYGRLYVPDAMIDVALYKGYSQSICDRQDSANIFSLGLDVGKTIADHSNQEFRKLFSVEVGTQGYIELENGDIINIVCVNVFNGHNNGVYITDEEGNNVMDVADFMMYTCRNGWRNVRICLWERY